MEGMTTDYSLNDVIWRGLERFLVHRTDSRMYLLTSYVAQVGQVDAASAQTIPRSALADQGLALFDAAGRYFHDAAGECFHNVGGGGLVAGMSDGEQSPQL